MCFLLCSSIKTSKYYEPRGLQYEQIPYECLSIHSTEIVHNVSNQNTDVNSDVHYQNLRKLMALLIVP